MPLDTEPQIHRTPVEKVIDQLGFGWYQVIVIVIMGIAQATDTMETFIQAILGPSLRCDWKLNPDYVALLATMVFVGVCIGSPTMGYLSDRFGRKALCVLCCWSLIYMTWLCAIANIYVWLAILRFISGIYISGLLTSGSSFISEVLPELLQSTGQLIVCSFDSFVALFITGIGLACLKVNLSWRYFLFFSTAPLILSAIGLNFCIYESPAILAQWGDRIEAARVLDKIAKINKRVPEGKTSNVQKNKDNSQFSFVGRLAVTEEHENIEISFRGFVNVAQIFYRRYPLTLPLLIFVNFIWGFVMYGGTTLLPVELPAAQRTCLESVFRAERTTDDGPKLTGDEDCCLPMLEEGYISLFASVGGSFLSFPIAFILITWIGRRWTISICFLMTSILMFCEAFCLNSAALRVIFFATRAVAAAGNNSTSIYITNLFSPHVRSFAYGLMSTAFRVGVLAAPYIGQVYLQRVSALGAVLIFAGISLLGFFISLFLPHTENVRLSAKDHRHIFKNIFKHREPLTVEEAIIAASGDNQPIERIATIAKTYSELRQREAFEPNGEEALA